MAKPLFLLVLQPGGPTTLTKNYQTHVFVGLRALGGLATLGKDGQTFVFVGHSTSSGLVVVVENGLAFIMGSLTSCIDSANHGKGHQVHDPNVIFNDNVAEISNSRSNNPLFVPPCKKQENEGKNKIKSYGNTCKFQIEWAIYMPWVKGLVFKGGF